MSHGLSGEEFLGACLRGYFQGYWHPERLEKSFRILLHTHEVSELENEARDLVIRTHADRTKGTETAEPLCLELETHVIRLRTPQCRTKKEIWRGAATLPDCLLHALSASATIGLRL